MKEIIFACLWFNRLGDASCLMHLWQVLSSSCLLVSFYATCTSALHFPSIEFFSTKGMAGSEIHLLTNADL